jgi:hypothetical protein
MDCPTRDGGNGNLGHKRHHNDDQCLDSSNVNVPSIEDFTSSFKEIQFTPLHDQHLKKYIVGPIRLFF